jgi:acyl carrier protein
MTGIATDRFKDVLRPHLKYLDAGAELSLDDDLKSLGLDSMAAVNLLFDLEDELGVILPDELLVERTFATGVALLEAIESTLVVA